MEDTNDNSPIFTSLPSEAVTVNENEKPGKVATFKATDRDSGAFGQVVTTIIILIAKRRAAIFQQILNMKL